MRVARRHSLEGAATVFGRQDFITNHKLISFFSAGVEGRDHTTCERKAQAVIVYIERARGPRAAQRGLPLVAMPVIQSDDPDGFNLSSCCPYVY